MTLLEEQELASAVVELAAISRSAQLRIVACNRIIAQEQHRSVGVTPRLTLLRACPRFHAPTWRGGLRARKGPARLTCSRG